MLQRVDSNLVSLRQQRLVGQADIVLTANVQALLHGVAESLLHQRAAGEVIAPAGGVLFHPVVGVGLFFLDVAHPAPLFPHVGVVGAAQRVRVEAFVGRDRAGAAAGCHEVFEVLPIP